MSSNTKPLEAINHSFTAQELAQWLSLIYDASQESFLLTFIDAAADIIIKYTGYELLSREYLTTAKASQVPMRPSIIAVGLTYSAVKLPIYPIITIDSVKVDDDVIEYEESELIPKLIIPRSPTTDAVSVRYTAGHATWSDVPASYKQAIISLAGYLYDHRGECAADDALTMSGTRKMIEQYKLYAGGL